MLLSPSISRLVHRHPGIASPAPTSVPVTGNLIGAWRLDEASTGATEVKRKSYLGGRYTWQDPQTYPSSTEAIRGKSIHYDAGTSKTYLVQPDPSYADFTGSFTAVVWVYQTTGTFAELFNKTSTNLWPDGWVMAVSGTTLYMVARNSGGQVQHTTTVPNPTAGWVMLYGGYDATAGKLFAGYNDNGKDVDLTSLTAPLIANPTIPLTLGSEYNGVSYVRGYLDCPLLYDDVLTDQELSDIYNGGAGPVIESWSLSGERSGTVATVVVCDGDSLTEGASAAGTLTANSYPRQVEDLLGPTYSVANYGVGGQTLNQMETDAASQIDPLIEAGKTNVLVAWGGTNDMWGGDSAATALSDLQTYYDNRKTAGWDHVITLTCLHRNGEAAFNTKADTFNTSLKASPSTYCDALIDIETTLNDPSDSTYFAADGIHTNANGNRVIAAAVNTAIAAL